MFAKYLVDLAEAMSLCSDALAEGDLEGRKLAELLRRFRGLLPGVRLLTFGSASFLIKKTLLTWKKKQ